MPVDWKRYPTNWKEIRSEILIRANHACERCFAKNYEPHPVTGSKVILTIAHIGPTKHDKMDCRPEVLLALCQRCHLTEDLEEHLQNRRKNLRLRKEKEGQLSLLIKEDDK